MTVALSPDGMHLVYVGQAGETSRLLKRRIDEREFTAIPGTEGASGPFFSPDGLWLGFFAQGRLKKVSFTGGAPVMLCDGDSTVGASWGAGDTIIFSQSSLSGLSRVSADGGVCEALTTLESSKGERSHRWPAFLPDGRHVMFTVETTNIASFDAARIEVLSLGTGDRRTILEGGTGGRYLPTGHLVYATAGRLLAAPFDLRQLAITGAPTVVLDDLIKDPGGGSAHFAVSESGTLVYMPGPGQVEARSHHSG